MKDALSARLGLTRTVRLLESTRLQVPVVVGWLRPVLLVPTAVLGGLSPQQLEAVIAHELAHIRRHDYLVNLLQSAVETLLFYHPAVWWVSSAVRAEREHCCDDLAVVACGDAVLYARALTAIETLRHEEMGVAMAITGSPLLARVRRLLGAKPPTTAASSGWIVALLTAVMVSGAGVTSWMRGVPVEFADAERNSPPSAHVPPRRPRSSRRVTTISHATWPGSRPTGRCGGRWRIRNAPWSPPRGPSSRRNGPSWRANRARASAEARQLAREAMRQAHEMMRAAQLAARDAARAMRDAERAARSWSVGLTSRKRPRHPSP